MTNIAPNENLDGTLKISDGFEIALIYKLHSFQVEAYPVWSSLSSVERPHAQVCIHSKKMCPLLPPGLPSPGGR